MSCGEACKGESSASVGACGARVDDLTQAGELMKLDGGSRDKSSTWIDDCAGDLCSIVKWAAVVFDL